MSLTVGELVAYLDLDANPFTKGLDRAMQDGERAGQRMSQVGGTLTRGVTLPLLAAGGAAVKLGTDFDTAFSRMVGLAGVPAAEVDSLKESVLDLAGETAVAPQELADALYFAASAGLDAAGAMDAVTFAAKASAAGMGSAQAIVGLTASAVESYGKANIDAARATDILTAAVRAGRADPEELAGTLGRVLPVASQLGISFEEVGGAVAYLSNVFGDTNRTVTALSGLMVKLVSPTKGGRQALADMGTSVEELQSAIDQDGLMGALDLLRTKGFAGNQQALRALFDDIEGYQAALALLNDRSGSLVDTMDEVAGSTGALGEAFDAAAGTDGFKMKQALVDLQVAAIAAGDVIGPFVASVLGGVADIASAFASLPGPAQTVVLAFAGILAATGPLLSIGGKLLTNWKSISSGLETLALKSMYAKGAISNIGVAKVGAIAGGAAAAGVGIFALAMFKASERAEKLRRAARELADEAESTGKTLEEVALDKLVREFAESDQVARAISNTGTSFAELGEHLRGSQEDFDAWAESARLADQQVGAVGNQNGLLVGRVEALREQLGKATEVTDRTSQANEELGITAEAAAPKVDDLADGISDAEKAAEDAEKAMDAFKDAIDRAFAPMDLQAAEDRFTSAMRDMAESVKDAGAKLEGNSEQAIDNRARLDDIVRSAGDVIQIMAEQGASTEELTRRKNELIWRMVAEAGQMGLNVDKLGIYRQAIEDLPTDASLNLSVDTSAAYQSVDEFLAYLNSIGARNPTGFTSLLRFKQDQLLKAHSGGTVPGSHSEEVPMLLLGGETVRTVAQERELQQQIMGGGSTTSANGGQAAGGGSLVVEVPVILDGREIGRSKAVIEGMDTVRARRERNTAGAA